MKRTIYLFLICLVTSCQNEDQSGTTHSSSSTETVPEKKVKKPKFPKFDSVVEMLKDANDYTEEEKTLKVISKEPIHVQVSKTVFEGDAEKLIEEQVKRDIVYVSLQAFAQTDIDKIKITSVPLKLKNDMTFDKYLDKYKKTVTVTRKNADEVLQKYLQTSDYKKLYELFQGKIYVPSKEFEKLKHQELPGVYKDLTK